jgi:Predicted membrane protein (DUF2079)
LNPSNRPNLYPFLLAAVAIVARSAVFVLFEQSHFDSDQAIVGLMAKHLSEGRALPLFFYGQGYLLAVEAWLAAPLFWMAGPSVALLKLPLVAINIATAGLLLWLLCRDVALKASAALASVIWFLAAPVVVASRLVEAQGGNVEPVFYALAFWALRRRTVALGLLFGFGLLHREFVLLAFGALVIGEALDATNRTIAGARRLVAVIAIAACVHILGNQLRPWSDVFGPGTPPLGAEATRSFDALRSGVCLSPRTFLENVRWAFTENLPTLFGARRYGPNSYFQTTQSFGYDWLCPVLSLLLLAGACRAAYVLWHERAAGRAASRFALYLLLLAPVTIAGYAAGCSVKNPLLIRYTLLATLGAVGLTALLLRLEPNRTIRRIVVAVVLGWAALSARDHIRLLHEYIVRPPASEYRLLADTLVGRGLRYAYADYWVAYHVAFLSNERVVFVPNHPVRIRSYVTEVRTHDAEAVVILRAPCRDGLRVGGFFVCGGAVER